MIAASGSAFSITGPAIAYKSHQHVGDIVDPMLTYSARHVHVKDMPMQGVIAHSGSAVEIFPNADVHVSVAKVWRVGQYDKTL